MEEKQQSFNEKNIDRRSENENFTDKEAAVFLRISVVSLWRARKKGLITFRRIMGRIIYTHQDLLDFLERSKTGGFNA